MFTTAKNTGREAAIEALRRDTGWTDDDPGHDKIPRDRKTFIAGINVIERDVSQLRPPNLPRIK